MDADGTNRRVFAQNASYGGGASWSPDGSEIVYGAFGQEPGQPYNRVMIAPAGDPSEGRFLVAGANPSWSPDGSRIVFTVFGDSPDLYLVSPDGTNQTPLATGRGTQTTPVWSPDSSRIAFLDYPSAAPGPPELVVVDADGSDRRVIPTVSELYSAPAWSPDGNLLAYVAGGDVHTYDLVTGAQTNLTRDSEPTYHVEWAPSQRIAYSGDGEVWVIDPDGTDETHVHSGFMGAWMPDGARLLLTLGDDILVTRPGTEGTANLTASPDREFGPQPSPDGSRILYLREPPVTPPRTYDRTVGAALSGRRLAGELSAEDGYSLCTDGKKVVLQRFATGGWRRVDAKRTNGRGEFRWRLPARNGFYRVHAPRVSDGIEWGTAYCAAASSPPLRYRR